jgi:hypothetical protein
MRHIIGKLFGIKPQLSELIGRDVKCSIRAQERKKPREKEEKLLFGGGKEHSFVRRFPRFAVSSF